MHTLAAMMTRGASARRSPRPIWPYWPTDHLNNARVLLAYQQEFNRRCVPKPGGGYELTAVCPTCRQVTLAKSDDTTNVMTWECQSCEVAMDPLEQIIEHARRVGGGDN